MTDSVQNHLISCFLSDCSQEAAEEAIADGPEALWKRLRAKKNSPRDAYYAVVDKFNRDAIYKGLTYPDVSYY